jgi:hypothetical protein
MTNRELDELLKSAPVPERDSEYWDEFPSRVMRGLERSSNQESPGRAATPAGEPARAGGLWPKLAFVTGLAAVCLVIGLLVGLHQGRQSAGNDLQLAEARKCYGEVETLFPNQVQALVLNATGGHLVLAPEPNVPKSAPLYVKICGTRGCQRFVTFSGQRIAVNGIFFEVLVDRQGEVLLVGEQSVWSSSEPGEKLEGYRIEARPLLTKS